MPKCKLDEFDLQAEAEAKSIRSMNQNRLMTSAGKKTRKNREKNERINHNIDMKFVRKHVI